VLAWIALVGPSCAKPDPPPPPPPPPPPTVQPVPVTPQEDLSIQGRYQPVGGGKYLVVIFVNGQRTIEGSLSDKKRRDNFHAKYEDHDIDADCVLQQKVDCVISIDGAPQLPSSPPPQPASDRAGSGARKGLPP
jgi:hypothetical protein